VAVLAEDGVGLRSSGAGAERDAATTGFRVRTRPAGVW